MTEQAKQETVTCLMEGFHYATPEQGDLFRLYLYDRDEGTRHGGKLLFTSGEIHDPGRIVGFVEAMTREMIARFHQFETRVTNSSDELVFHSKDGVILYPRGMTGGEFWSLV